MGSEMCIRDRDMSDEQIEELIKQNEVEEPEPQNPLLDRLKS